MRKLGGQKGPFLQLTWVIDSALVFGDRTG